jgi:hypothetical protein
MCDQIVNLVEQINGGAIKAWTHVRRRQRDKTLPAGTY